MTHKSHILNQYYNLFAYIYQRSAILFLRIFYTILLSGPVDIYELRMTKLTARVDASGVGQKKLSTPWIFTLRQLR